MASNGAGCVSRAKASAPRRAPGCFAGCAWDNWKLMSLGRVLQQLQQRMREGTAAAYEGGYCSSCSSVLVSELLGYLASHGVDDVTLTGSLLSCFLDYNVNVLPKIRYPGKVEQNVLDCAKVFCSERTLSV